MSTEGPQGASAEEQKEMEDKVTTKMKNKQVPTAAWIRQRSLVTTFPLYRAFLNRNHPMLLASWLAD
uniref:Uncharacterized protein n=1 Tax=Equus caballus TaxID=9796 RepID=A0A9L0SDE6_HORSE